MIRLTGTMFALTLMAGLIGATALLGCGDDENEADRRGVGAQCASNDDCQEEGQVCLTEFSGGYCGVADCAADAGCPSGSKCVIHDDGNNYCFRTCQEKAECNTHRDEAVEANCSSNVVFVEDESGIKACVPPSSGI